MLTNKALLTPVNDTRSGIPENNHNEASISLTNILPSISGSLESIAGKEFFELIKALKMCILF